MSQNQHSCDNECSAPATLPPDKGRRFLLGSACAMGGIAGVATLVPFVASMSPSERAKAAGAPVIINLNDIAAGTMKIAEWQGKPIWIINRTSSMLEGLKDNLEVLADAHSERAGYTPIWAKNEYRSRQAQWFVSVGICTHLGCSPSPRFVQGNAQGMPSDWKGGFLCPCHGSHFDLAGRVFKNQPAPDNLLVPPYYFIDENTIMVGQERA